MQTIAVITGGAGVIGRAIAAELSQTHHIALVDVTLDGLQEAAQAFSRCSIHLCDITDAAAVSQMAHDVLEHGQVQILVNNAGHAWAESLQETTTDVWRREIALNLDAAFYCFKAFEESLKATPGANIVNIASVNGLTFVGNPAYSSAKAGLIQLTSAIAVEYAQFGIRANCVAPGSVRTGAWEARLKTNPNALDDVLKWYPLKKVIEPVHVAKAVTFLGGPDAATITGVCLPVDAGLTAGSSAIAKAVTGSEFYA